MEVSAVHVTETATVVRPARRATDRGAAAVAERPAVGHGPEPAGPRDKPGGGISWKVLHEMFFNPGLFLLFGGILVGFLARLQGKNVTDEDDPLFLNLFRADFTSV